MNWRKPQRQKRYTRHELVVDRSNERAKSNPLGQVLTCWPVMPRTFWELVGRRHAHRARSKVARRGRLRLQRGLAIGV
eukprot:464655-Amphidinium_carterae.1